MEIRRVEEALAPEGLGPPVINALVANAENYSVLLMQPCGHIEASAAGVRNRDRELAGRQFGRFLADARQTGADLVVTPEYSMPWETLVGAIKNGTVPGEGKLWALGCESIKYSALEGLKHDLAALATVVFEPLQPDEARFTDPLAYVFVARPAEGGGAAKIVILVQFNRSVWSNPKRMKDLLAKIPLKQIGEPDEIARMVVVLVSDAASYVTGRTIFVDGGMTDYPDFARGG